MDERQRRVIVAGIAAKAVARAEMGASEDEARSQIVDMLQPLDVAVVREAALEVVRGPQPLDESPEERGTG